MIISHKYKFIFIKTRKTAGTSIEVALSRYCGENDIVTPIFPAVEGHRPRNYKKFYQSYWFHVHIPKRLYKGFYDHMPASEILRKISPDMWHSYYKFCFERNPYDKVASFYFFHKRPDKIEIDFKEFCSRCYNGTFKYGLPVDFDKYGTQESAGGKNLRLLVDFVGKYESLVSDFSQICGRLGIPFDGTLTREKASTRPKEDHYSKYYDPQTINIVSSAFRREIALFGYRFESENVFSRT